MLTIWVLNVGHGNAAIIKYDGPEGAVFGIVDSNRTGQTEPRILVKLRELGAESLSFITISHPHADHYSGLLPVFQAFRGRIGQVYLFPIGLHLTGRLKKFAKIYAKLALETDSTTVKQNTEEFISILSEIRSNVGLENCEERTGEYNLLLPSGFSGVELASILPPAAVKGQYFQMIEQGNATAIESQKENDLSLAISLKYSGRQVILGGDGTFANWVSHRRSLGRQNRTIEGNIVKLPHHGARTENNKIVLEHLFASGGERIAVISANGQSHPHPETLKTLQELGVKPYCTNLSKYCGANIRALPDIGGYAPVLRRQINMFATEPSESTKQVCQGDIQIDISSSGEITVSRQYDHPCPYRGDFGDLFATI